MCPAGAHLGNLSYLHNRRSSTPVRPPRDLSFLLTLATGLHCLPVATASVGCKYPFCGPELQQIASRRQDIFPASSTSVWGPLWSRSRWCCASSDVALLPLDLVLPLLHAFCGIASSQNLHDFCKGPDERRPLPPFILGRVPWARIPLLECVYVEQMLRRPARGCTALKAVLLDQWHWDLSGGYMSVIGGRVIIERPGSMQVCFRSCKELLAWFAECPSPPILAPPVGQVASDDHGSSSLRTRPEPRLSVVADRCERMQPPMSGQDPSYCYWCPRFVRRATRRAVWTQTFR